VVWHGYVGRGCQGGFWIGLGLERFVVMRAQNSADVVFGIPEHSVYTHEMMRSALGTIIVDGVVAK
jgi:hypothetical protein